MKQREELVDELARMEAIARKYLTAASLAVNDPRCEALQEEVSTSREIAETLLLVTETGQWGITSGEDAIRAHERAAWLLARLNEQTAWMDACGQAAFVQDLRVYRS
ncbi:MAG: hypothetical protein K2Y42_12595 [Hyphomicrobium sp.]|jgi:hypothetical protein|uniref:hypothetical protein n=1 Tax=Hyphomicrobium sp. TaxID=82 RepID=UPI0025B8D0F4|nr:hypothetical protein [Hyphomicrobium sp.]MBX9863577.1 hypothetical protein [Hyphomicrobium sp.]